MTEQVSKEERAYQKILRCVSVREQSSIKMREKLSNAGFSEEVIDCALDRAMRTSAIDDARYANALIRMTISRGKGLAFVEREIEALGLHLEEMEAYAEYLEDYPQSDEARALDFLRRHPPRSKNQREGAFRKLVSQGYSISVAGDAAQMWATGTS